MRTVTPVLTGLLLATLGGSRALAATLDTKTLETAVEGAYQAYRHLEDGEPAQYIPALATADPDRFAIVLMTVDGKVITRGDSDVAFPIMSAAKPFTAALVMQQRGAQALVDELGVEPTGDPFNALTGIIRTRHEPLNPLVNAGAITAVSMIRVEEPRQRWPLLLDYLSRFAGEPLQLQDAVYQSVSTSNYRNRALVNLLQQEDWLEAEADTTLDIYNRQSCVAVTAQQLAVMGATLANAGVNPVTREPVLAPELVMQVLALMTLNGFYDESGWWAFTAGLPAKSGVGGGIVAVAPGELAIATYSPRLSPAGNSMRGMLAIQAISRELGLSLFNPGTAYDSTADSSTAP
ncbi:glutaminase A [Seongchinamella unica]|uniref:Glutaminase n=1 Tax=Seongchinamella unica TaxID=2547392 RepID=A0A4R5LUC7_9GAMM|nr:glutaminase A [Seongchinamella unica]TDG14798.1 glutaminase A [Seongchinamella unica]